MRIALVHSFYRSDAPSGENIAVLRQAEALRTAGHEVLLVARHSDEEMKTRGYPAKAALTVATGVGPSPLDEIRRYNPDVVHVHNLFPNFGDRWVGAWKGPLVVTLHNYRPICANGLLFRDGGLCTLCPDGDRWAGLRYRCYRESRIATLPLSLRNLGGPDTQALLRRADRIIVLSERARMMWANSGIAASRTVVIPNGLPESSAPRAGSRRGWVVVGRLTPEKGILELLEDWPSGQPLDIIGDGELSRQIQQRLRSRPLLRLLGGMENDEVAVRLPRYEGLVFPSLCIENFPTVVAESLRAGTPVLAREGNAAADYLSDHTPPIGGTYAGADELEVALLDVTKRGPELSADCIRSFRAELGYAAWSQALVDVYSGLATRTP